MCLSSATVSYAAMTSPFFAGREYKSRNILVFHPSRVFFNLDQGVCVVLPLLVSKVVLSLLLFWFSWSN